jgi:hypothetical protein
VASIIAEQVTFKKFRILPLLHPENLLARIVIDDKRIGEGLQVGVTEDSDRKQDYEHQVRSGRPG